MSAFRKPAIGTSQRDDYDRREKLRRMAWKNRQPCDCGSGRLADPKDGKCVACLPALKQILDRWYHKGSPT